MDPSRRVPLGVTVLALVAALAVPVRAQVYENARRDPGPSSDPLARSPRLVGMGGLMYALDDPHLRIDLWELFGNAAGILEADSVSRLELYPGTQSASNAYDLAAASLPRERQDFALREVRMGYEAWRRSSVETAFGLMGDFNSLRTDQPSAPDLERRRKSSVPNTLGAISGRMPFFQPDRLRYGFALRHRYEVVDDDYQTFVRNAAGEFIDKNGNKTAPPDFFIPDHHGVRSLGMNTALAYRAAKALTLGAGYDYFGNVIESRNDGDRYSTELKEKRPYSTLHTEAIVTVGSFQYGQRFESWNAASDQSWVFTLSTGTGSRPISGRGRYADRDEKGRGFRSRARWMSRAFELGAGLNTYYSRVDLSPAPITDPESFNYFRDFLYNKVGLDTLTLPDSVMQNRTDRRAWDAGIGASCRLPFRQSILGVEFRTERATLEQTVSGPGPKGKGWGVRAGLDVPVTPVLHVQGGYGYGRNDLDERTAQNEYVTHSVSAGLGLNPDRGAWELDLGYRIDVRRSDFDDPVARRGNAQQGLFRLRWRL